jgi:hypothetical protein
MPQQPKIDNIKKLYGNLQAQNPDILGSMSESDFVQSMSDYNKAKKFYSNMAQDYSNLIGDMGENDFLGNVFDQKPDPVVGKGSNKDGVLQKVSDGDLQFNSDNAKFMGYLDNGDQVAQVSGADNKSYGVVRNKDTGEWRYYRDEKYNKSKPKSQTPIDPETLARNASIYSVTLSDKPSAPVAPQWQKTSNGWEFDSSSPDTKMLGTDMLNRDRALVKLKDGSYAEVARNPDGSYKPWTAEDQQVDDLARKSYEVNTDDAYKNMSQSEKVSMYEKSNYEPGIIDNISKWAKDLGWYAGPLGAMLWDKGDKVIKKENERDALVGDYERKRDRLDVLEAKVDRQSINDTEKAEYDKLKTEVEDGSLEYMKKKGLYESTLVTAAKELINPDKNTDDVYIDKLSPQEKDNLFQFSDAEWKKLVEQGYAYENPYTGYELKSSLKKDQIDAALKAGDIETANRLTTEYQRSPDQKTLTEFKMRIGAVNAGTNALSTVYNMYEANLKRMFGSKYDEYVKFLSEDYQQKKDEYDAAVMANDRNKATKLASELNQSLEYFSDISNSEQVKMINQISSKINANQKRAKELLSADNYVAAKNIMSQIKSLKDQAEISTDEIDKQYNEGKKATALWNLAGVYNYAAPHMIDRAVRKIPSGLVDVTAAVGGALDSDGKFDLIQGMQQQMHSDAELRDQLNPVSEKIANGSIYQILNVTSDLLPQAAIATLTGGAATALGLSARAAQFTGAVLSNMAMSVYDMAKANHDIMPDYLTEAEKWRFANTLAIIQTGSVGASGEMLGGALGALTGNRGILDDAIDNIFGLNQLTSAEINSIVRQHARLLTSGNAKGFLAAVKNDLASAYGSTLKAVAAGVRKAAASGTSETIEEVVIEPLAQKFTEMVYSVLGGYGDVSKMDQSASPMAEQPSMLQQGGVAWAVGALTKGASMAVKASNSIYNDALMLALDNPDQFINQYQILEAKFKERNANNAEMIQQFDKVKQQVMDEFTSIREQYDARKENVPEEMRGSLIELLRSKRDLESKADKLKPTRQSEEAAKIAAKSPAAPTTTAPIAPTAPTAPTPVTLAAPTQAPAAEAPVAQAAQVSAPAEEAAPATTAEATQAPAVETAPVTQQAQQAAPTEEPITRQVTTPMIPIETEQAPTVESNAKSYLSTLAELNKVNKQIEYLSTPQAKKSFLDVGRSLYNKVANMFGVETDEKNKAYINQSNDINEKAAAGKLTIADIEKSEYYNSLSEDQKGSIQQRLSDPQTSQEAQAEIARSLSMHNMSALNMRRTEESNKRMMAKDDADHNTSIRMSGEGNKASARQSIPDDDNIVYKQSRDYGVATQDEVDAIMRGDDVKIKTTKDSAVTNKNTKFVVEKKKNNDGTTSTRIFERRADGSYAVKYDEIGDKALMNSSDISAVNAKKFTEYGIRAEQRRQEIIDKNSTLGADGSKIYNEAVVNKALMEDKQYQSALRTKNKYSPSSTQVSELLALSKRTKEEEQRKVNEQIDALIAEKISAMEGSNELEKTGC